MAKREAVFPDAEGQRALYETHGYSASIRSGDLLFVSGQVGAREDGSPEPDFARQVQLAYDRLQGVLEAAGCTFDDVVDVTVFCTDPKSQSSIARTAREKAFGGPPRPNLTVVGATYLSGFDFEIKVIARIPAEASGGVSRRNPPTMWDMGANGFSQISVAGPGRIALLSGQVAAAPGDQAAPDDVAGQARLATASLRAALAEVDAAPQDILMLRAYVVDATTEKFRDVLSALRELLGDVAPSITTIGVQALYSPEIKVEIEMAVSLR